MKSVIVTGANGFIGSHLIPCFLNEGIDVYALVTKRGGPMWLGSYPHVHVVECDLHQYQQCLPHMPSVPDAVIHFAWAGVSPDIRGDFETQKQNIELCLNAVRLAHCVGAKRFIFPGSTLEYAYCGQLIDKNACPSPRDAYSAVKVSARYLCQELCRELDIPFIYAVIASIYSEDRNDGNVINYTITKLLNGEKPELTGLEQPWDYVHIEDVVRAVYLITVKGKAGAFYSIGHGDNWPLVNYIRQIHTLIDQSLPLGIGCVPYPDGQIPSVRIDLRPLRDDTGFEPEIPFDVGISRVIEKLRSEKTGIAGGASR